MAPILAPRFCRWGRRCCDPGIGSGPAGPVCAGFGSPRRGRHRRDHRRVRASSRCAARCGPPGCGCASRACAGRCSTPSACTDGRVRSPGWSPPTTRCTPRWPLPAVGSPLLGTGHVRRIMPCLEAPGRPAADVPVPARTQARRPADLGV